MSVVKRVVRSVSAGLLLFVFLSGVLAMDVAEAADADSTVTYWAYMGQQCVNNDNSTYATVDIFPSDGNGGFAKKATYSFDKGAPAVQVVLPKDMKWLLKFDVSGVWNPGYCVINSNATGWTFGDGCPDNATNGNCSGCGALDSGIRDSFHIGCVSTSKYDFLYLVDAKKGNLLFRGPKPVVQDSNGEWVFDYKNLITAMMRQAKAQSVQFPSGKFHFIDVSLISNAALQGEFLRSEYLFFGGDPSTNATAYSDQPHGKDNYHALSQIKIGDNTVDADGKMWWWNMQAKQEGAKDSFIGDMAGKLGSYLDSTGPVPNVVYIHCNAGVDRTGEMAISYFAANYAKMTPEQAWVYGTTVAPNGQMTRKPPCADFLVGAEWYYEKTTGHVIPVGDTATLPGTAGCPCDYPWDNGTNCGWLSQ